jgi:hypothetical protein
MGNHFRMERTTRHTNTINAYFTHSKECPSHYTNLCRMRNTAGANDEQQRRALKELAGTVCSAQYGI